MENEEDAYVPPSQEEESEEFSFLSAQVNVKPTEKDIPTEIDGFLTQEASAGPAVTPSPKYCRGFCQLCQNSPCVAMVDGPFLIKRAEKTYEKMDTDVNNMDNTELLQKLSEEFIDGYKLLKQHYVYLPGDDEITDVGVHMCMYTRFHEWSKDLL